MNSVVLSGRLGTDPELSTTPTGVEVVNFRIAVARSYDHNVVDWFDIVAWRKTAVFICQHFKKGSGIEINGELQTRQYQAKDGTNRNVVEVVATNVGFSVGRGKQSDNTNDSTTATEPQNDVTSKLDELNNMTDEAPTPDDDDLPF